MHTFNCNIIIIIYLLKLLDIRYNGTKDLVKRMHINKLIMEQTNQVDRFQFGANSWINVA